MQRPSMLPQVKLTRKFLSFYALGDLSFWTVSATVLTGHLYVKSDVYGFGVVLVEMLTGLRALDTTRPSRQHNLVDWIKPYLSDRRKLKSIMDSHLAGKYPSKAAVQTAQLALRCLGPEPRFRPSMKEVLETLERIESSNEKPRERRVGSMKHTGQGQRPLPLQYRSPLHPKQDGIRARWFGHWMVQVFCCVCSGSPCSLVLYWFVEI